MNKLELVSKGNQKMKKNFIHFLFIFIFLFSDRLLVSDWLKKNSDPIKDQQQENKKKMFRQFSVNSNSAGDKVQLTLFVLTNLQFAEMFSADKTSFRYFTKILSLNWHYKL